jgi:hypothetical protein
MRRSAGVMKLGCCGATEPHVRKTSPLLVKQPALVCASRGVTVYSRCDGSAPAGGEVRRRVVPGGGTPITPCYGWRNRCIPLNLPVPRGSCAASRESLRDTPNQFGTHPTHTMSPASNEWARSPLCGVPIRSSARSDRPRRFQVQRSAGSAHPRPCSGSVHPHARTHARTPITRPLRPAHSAPPRGTSRAPATPLAAHDGRHDSQPVDLRSASPPWPRPREPRFPSRHTAWKASRKTWCKSLGGTRCPDMLHV